MPFSNGKASRLTLSTSDWVWAWADRSRPSIAASGRSRMVMAALRSASSKPGKRADRVMPAGTVRPTRNPGG